MDAFFAALAGSGSALTWSGLGLLVILSVMLGWFVPKRTHDRMIQIQAEASALALKTQAEAYNLIIDNLTQQLASSSVRENEWKLATHASEEVAAEVRSQNRTMLEKYGTMVHALEGLRSGMVESVRANRETQ